MWYTVRIKEVNQMLDFKYPEFSQKAQYKQILHQSPNRGCEYNFANLILWGRQRIAFHEGNIAFFSQFDRKSVYPFPLGQNLKPTLDAIIHDAKTRDIPCRLTGLSQDDCATLERLYPGKFRIHFDRDSFDYVYDISDLADLKGRKYQKKRNHINRFWQAHPNCQAVPITGENQQAVEEMVAAWYAARLSVDPDNDYHLEKQAIRRAFANMENLGLEGLALTDSGNILAMTIGSALSANTFDIHFEKAMDYADGAYPAIAQAFAAHLRSKYPDLQYLNREEDMGIPGLRQSKLSYFPHHLVVKFWARLWEDDDED